MSVSLHEHIRFSRRGVSRRNFLHTVSASAIAAGTLGFTDLMSLSAEELRKKQKSVILLWMQGGPSQFETFDPKPGTETGGPTTAIGTSVPGIQIAHAWGKTAQVMDDLAIIRSMTNNEGNHPRATYQLHTGYIPAGSVKHPSLASNLAMRLEDPTFDLPSVVCVGAPPAGANAGYLGVNYEPFVVNNPDQLPQNVATQVDDPRLDRRMKLLGRVESQFAKAGAERVVSDHQKLYGKTAKMVQSKHLEAFDLNRESSSVKALYGEGQFAMGCLLARRLVETGVTFVEVVSRNWDSHRENFDQTSELAGQVDPGMAGLITDLKQRGMLENTLVVWMGEFGRTPRINPNNGRDHYPRAFNAVLAGCGVKGGQVIGSTTKDGSAVEDNPVKVGDLFSTICKALEVDPDSETISPLGRPMRIVDEGTPVEGLLG